MEIVAIALLAVSSAFSSIAQADDVLNLKIADLYARVAGQFQAEPYPGMPVPKMMERDLFAIAVKSYCGLMESGDAKDVTQPGRFTVVDYNQSAKVPRLYIYDVKSQRIIRNTWASHGSGSSLYFYKDTGSFEVKNTPNVPVIGYHVEAPLFFSNDWESGQSSVGMAIAASAPYKSNKDNDGLPVGTAVHMKGIDGKLNNNLFRRGVVIHGSDFRRDQFLQWGALPSDGCVVVDNRIADAVRREMMGAPVILYHDRLFPENNHEEHEKLKNLIKGLSSKISSNVQAPSTKYSWSPATRQRVESELQKQIAEYRRKSSATYEYFKSDSRFITFEPRDPKRCAERLGI